MSFKLNLRVVSLFASLICVVASVVPAFAGQPCGTFFKPGYRAVGKIDGSPFTGARYELGDWTGDGRSDFWQLRTVSFQAPREIRVFRALATGGWDWNNMVTYTINIPSAQWVDFQTPVLRDFDGDGDIDLLVTTTESNRRLILLRNAGDGTLQPGTPSPDNTTNGFARPIGFGDVNGDGRLDRLFSEQFVPSLAENIVYSTQNADGSFAAPVTVVNNSNDPSVNNAAKSAGDFDGDGKVDIAWFGSPSSGGNLKMIKNLGNGTFAPAVTTSSTATGTDVADLNSDGRMDVIGRSSGLIVIYYGQTSGSFTSTSLTARNGSNGVPNPRFADLSADGRVDMINVAPAEYETFINSASGTFTNNVYARRLRTDNTILFRVEDFTGDGKADIIDLSHNIKNVFGEEVVAVEANTCEARGHVKGFNFDQSGPMDLLSWNPATGDFLSVNGDWPSTGQIDSRTFNWGLGSLGDIPAPGDFDGDGRSDYAVYRNPEGRWYVYLSQTSSWLVFKFGLPGDIPVPNDYDGGGRTDFAVFRPSEGNWYFWYNETQSFSAMHWGSNFDTPVPADYDGDGKIDAAVFRGTTGDWYYTRSSDQSYGIQHWGTTGDIPLPADYDGDGRADLTVFRSGVWYINRTSNDTMAVYNWGTTNDVALPLLETGEIAYPAVFRPSNSRWYHPKYFFGVVATPNSNPVKSGLSN